jgi:hypothetical protein
VQRLFTYGTLGALAVRGTLEQLATAEKVIEEIGHSERTRLHIQAFRESEIGCALVAGYRRSLALYLKGTKEPF